MRTRQLVWVALAVCGVVTAQQISTRLLSRQVAVTLREILGGGSLTDVATSMDAFRTNVPPGFLSKPAAAALVFDTMEATISNVTIAAVDSGVGLRFSVTNFYTFDDTSVVSTYNTHLSRSAAASIESITADQAYLSEAKLGSLITERLNASLLGPIGVVTTGVFTASGTTHLGSLEAGDLSVSRIAAPVLRSLPGEVSYYREVGRAAESWTTVSDMTNSWSVVPKPVFDQPNIVTNTLRISTGSYDMIITNLIPVTINYWDTNYADTVVSVNASGYTTNVVWLSIYTNQPAGTPVVTNEIQFLRTGSPPNYTFTPTNHVYTNGVPPVVYTNTFANPCLVVDTSEVYTNITTSPVFTYGDLTVVSTNAARRLAPDTGPVGVCTTSYVTRVYEPGVLRTNASGRLYIHEPTAIKPAGSGTKEAPFIMSVPENFRWVRENHKPGGREGLADVSNVYFADDAGGQHSDRYETSWFRAGTAELANGTLAADGSTYCIQTNSIDMTETFLWSSHQWPNGEYVEGFLGISGAPAALYYPRITNTVPALVAPYGTPFAARTNLYATLYPGTPVIHKPVSSRYALLNWPNKRFNHRIIYDGQGHSLLGIWESINPDAHYTARGLLGNVTARPEVSNLNIGGFIGGSHKREPTELRDINRYGAIAIGGLFGFVDSAVYPSFYYGGWPNNATSQYEVVRQSIALGRTEISNCVVFLDADMQHNIPDGTGVVYDASTYVGGVAGLVGMTRNDYFFYHAIQRMPVGIGVNGSSFVGRRRVLFETRADAIQVGPMFGCVSEFGIVPRREQLDMASWIPWGLGHRFHGNMFLHNTDVSSGPGNYTYSSSSSMRDGSINIYDGLLDYYNGGNRAPYGNYRGVYFTTPARIATQIALGYPRPEELSNSLMSASNLGYYGNVSVFDANTNTTLYRTMITSVDLSGRFGGSVVSELLPSDTDYALVNSMVSQSGYRAVVAQDSVRVISLSGLLNSQRAVSIDGSLGSQGYMWGSGYYYKLPPDNYPLAALREYGIYHGDAYVVASLQALRDEEYMDCDERADWGAGRFNNPNIIVRSAEEMKKPYVVEPKNAVGGGDTAHDVSYPYRNYSLDDWTQPGDLDGWYPVPRGAAGLTYSNQAAIVTSVWQPANIINISNDTCVVYATNTTTTTTYRYGDLSFTNYYAVAATQTSPTTCVFTVQNQVYHRHSESERHVVTTTAVVSTNSYQSYERSLSIDSRLVASGPVTVSGTVYRANANSLDPRVEAFVVDTRGNDYGTFRIQGTNVTPVVVAAQFTCTNNAISFVGPVFPIYFEWWPDQRSGAGALISVVRGGTPILLDQFNACDTLDGDHFVFNAPTPGYVIIRRGRPTDGLTLVDAGVSGVPDATRFRTESNAVFQVSFVLASDGPPRMAPLPDSLWTRTNFHGAAATNGISAIGAAFIDGTNQPYDAVLRADIFNAGGSRLSDREFFESVSVFCNYAAPEYLIPGEPAILNPVRTSLTAGYVEYPIHVRQLVVLQALGNLGASVTLTLLPGEYLYD